MTAELLSDWRTVYKLTDHKGQSYNATQWGAGVMNPCGILHGRDGLCGGGFYHAYHAIELAVFLNPRGAAFKADTMRLWEAEIRGTVETDYGILKLGATEMRTVRELDCPRPTTLQRTAFGVLAALATVDAAGLTIPGFVEWGTGWLSNLDRSSSAAVASAASASAASSAYAAAYDSASAVASAVASAASASAASSAYAAYAAASAAAYAAYDAAKWDITGLLVDAAVLALADSWEN